MIQLRNITKKYDRTVLNDVSCDFEMGKLYVIRGVSGCGKTTLLNIIGGLEADYEGSYYFDGADVRKDKKMLEAVCSNIGYIFQESLLFASLNVLENLLFIKNDQQKIEELSKLLGVELLLDKMPNELSNGERQRISIIRALLFDPDVILADEPTASLDHLRCKDIEDILFQLRDMGKIVIVSTHDTTFGKQADQILELHYGRMNNQSISDIKKDSQHKKKKKANSMWLIDARYCMRRGKRMSIGTIILYTLIFTILLLIYAIRLNFQGAFETYAFENYPCHVESNMLSNEDLIDIYSNDIMIYEDYHFIDNKQYVNGLYSKKDSSFSIPGAISYGKFPERNNEVLINEAYAKNILHLKDPKDALNKDITIKEKRYSISGVITNNKKRIERIYESDDYLNSDDIDENNVYMPYDEIKHIGIFHESQQRVIAINSIIGNKDAYAYVYTYWYHYVSEITNSINLFMDVFLLIAAALAFIMFLFLMNVIRLEMMYRKREIGYMRIFSISNKRIHHMILMDYIMKVSVSLILSNVGMLLLSFVIFHKIHIWILLSPIQWLLFMMILLIYLWILTRLGIGKILKSPVKELI